MNIANSECSSGCESGWTMYFDQYSDSSQFQYNKIGEEQTLRSRGKFINEDGIEQEEDEDLSMVSDASSGPPHNHEIESFFVRNEYISHISDQTKEKKKTKKGEKTEEDRLNYDDTASSPVGYVSKEKSAFNKHLSFLKTSVKGKGDSKKTGALHGKKW